MYRIYRTVTAVAVNAYFWLLDYIYVVFWQIARVGMVHSPTRYKNGNAQTPPIILIPGIYEKWHFMKPLADTLSRRGYAVHVVQSLGYNTGQVDEMAERVQAYARKHNLSRYAVVAHSKGGLIAKYLLGLDPQAMTRVVTINTPFGGSRYAGLFPLRSLRLFMPTSTIILLLAKDALSNAKITSLYSLFDPHIPDGSFLKGATNHQLDMRGHFRIMSSKQLHRTVIQALEQQAPTENIVTDIKNNQ